MRRLVLCALGAGALACGRVEATGPGVTLQSNRSTIDCGGMMTLTVEVDDFELVAPTGQGREPGRGHYHLYLDDASGGNYLHAGAEEVLDMWMPTNLSAGEHRLRIELMNHDHSPVFPPITDEITFEVTENVCIATWVDEYEPRRGDTITVFVQVGNFTLREPGQGVPNEAGQGHYHVYLDQSFGPGDLAMSGSESVDVRIPDMTLPGPHELRVVLVGNDHMPISPPTVSVMDIIVQP